MRWDPGSFSGRWRAILSAILFIIIIPVCPLPVQAIETSTTTVAMEVLVRPGSIDLQTGFMLERLEAAPFEENHLLFVPISFFSKAIDAIVQWDMQNGAATITLNSRTATVWLGRIEGLTDGQALNLEAPPLERQGVLFVPLPTLAEALGCTVQWDPSRQATVLIYTRILAYPHVPTLIYPEYHGMDVGAGQYKPQPTPTPSNKDREPLTIPAWAFWVAYGLILALLGWLVWAGLRKAGVKAVSSWVIAILFVAAVLGLLGVLGIQLALAEPHDFNLGRGTWPGSGVWGYPPWQYPLGPPSTVFRP